MPRKPIKINWDEFDKLCFIQCTMTEIAWWFDCSHDTIQRACHKEKKEGFASYYYKKAGKGRISLRRKQFETAIGGNVTMMIFLGKQYLEQSDKVEQQDVRFKDKSEAIFRLRETANKLEQELKNEEK